MALAGPRRTNRSRYTLALLILFSVTLITLNYKGEASKIIADLRTGAANVISPGQRGISDILRPVGNFFAGAVDYGSLSKQNAKLQDENNHLRSIILQASNDKLQLSQLFKLEKLPFAPSLPKVTAEVISGPASNFEITVELDKGRSSGVGVGMPVVDGGGLVGRVIEAGSDTSTVLILTDPRFAVGVRFGTQGLLGVTAGLGLGHPLLVQYILPGTKLKKGEVMYTSGLQHALFPPDIPVGKVISFSSAPNDLQETVKIAPTADLSNLEYLDVLEWLPPS